ncbi:hypothetical protein JCM17961_42440 [Endothiovibrio diazotrophicus]
MLKGYARFVAPLCALLSVFSAAASPSAGGLYRLDDSAFSMSGGDGISFGHELTAVSGQSTPAGESSASARLQAGFLYGADAAGPLDLSLLGAVADAFSTLLAAPPTGLNTRAVGQAIDRLALATAKLGQWQSTGDPALLAAAINQILNAIKKLDKSDPALTAAHQYPLAASLYETVLEELAWLKGSLGEGVLGIVAATGWMQIADQAIQDGDFEGAVMAVKRAFAELLPLYPA